MLESIAGPKQPRAAATLDDALLCISVSAGTTVGKILLPIYDKTCEEISQEILLITKAMQQFQRQETRLASRA